MPALSDARFAALRTQGFTGATSDMLLQWLQSGGATSNAIPDAWREMLAARGFNSYHRSDDWFEFLGSRGFTGNMNDRELAFWLSGGVLPAPGVSPLPPATLIAADVGIARVGYRMGIGGSLTPNEGDVIRVTQMFTRPLGTGRLLLYAEDKDTGLNLPQDFFTSITVGGVTLNSADADYSGERWRWDNIGLIMVVGESYAVSSA